MASLADLGPYFAVDSWDSGQGWRRLGTLLAPGPLTERVEHTEHMLARLAGVRPERRVAASTASLGLFARLVSPPLGAVTLGLRAPAMALDSTWWRPVDAGPWPIAADDVTDADDPLTPVLEGPIAALIDAFATAFQLSEIVLRGNAASAVFGALAMLQRSAADRTGRAVRVARDALDAGALRGTGTIVRGQFTRSSCCLYYRLPGGGYCGDCVIPADASLPGSTA